MDILEQLRTPLKYTEVDGVTVTGHPCGPLDDIIEEAADRIEQLQSQLPEGMKACTIQFKECPKGHGWLTATNWVQHGCPTCERDRLREPFKNTDAQDWDYILSLLPDNGLGKYWQCVLLGMRHTLNQSE